MLFWSQVFDSFLTPFFGVFDSFFGVKFLACCFCCFGVKLVGSLLEIRTSPVSFNTNTGFARVVFVVFGGSTKKFESFRLPASCKLQVKKKQNNRHAVLSWKFPIAGYREFFTKSLYRGGIRTCGVVRGLRANRLSLGGGVSCIKRG